MGAEKSHAEMNRAFADKVVADAMAVVRNKVAREKETHGFSSEIYYAVHIPYPPESAEHSYLVSIVGQGGSIENPDYHDLFEQVVKGVQDGLGTLGASGFVTLNCRFDAKLDDNLLLYVFARW